MRAAADKVGGEKVVEGVKVVNGVWRERNEPFQGWASKGGGEGFTEYKSLDVYRDTWVMYTLRCSLGFVSPAWRSSGKGSHWLGRGVVVMTSMKGWRHLGWCGGKGCGGMGCRTMVGNVVV